MLCMLVCLCVALPTHVGEWSIAVLLGHPGPFEYCHFIRCVCIYSV